MNNNNIITTTYANVSATIKKATNSAVSKINTTEMASESIATISHTKVFDKISQIPFSIEEYKIIILLKNGGSLTDLSFKQLILLATLYSFSNTDLIELQDNIEFIKYLNNKRITIFSALPEALKNQPNFAKQIFLSGDYTFLKYIPPENQTVEIYHHFIKYCSQDKLCYTCLPDLAKNLQRLELWDKYFLFYNCNFNVTGFALMPDELKTQKFCLQVCDDYIDNFRFVPDGFKTLSLCKSYLLKSQKTDIKLIPKKFKDELQDIFITRIKRYKTDANYKKFYLIEGLECLSTDVLKNNPDIIVDYCILSYNEAMLKIDSSCINSAILKKLAEFDITKIAKKYLTIDLVLLRLKSHALLKKKEEPIFDSYFMEYKDKIQPIALQRVVTGDINSIKYIPDYLNEIKCLQYIADKPYIYNQLPDKFKFNINIITYMLKKSPKHVKTLRSNLLTAEAYQTIFLNYPPAPKWRLSINQHQDHIEHKASLFFSVHPHHRSLDIWLYLCNNENRGYLKHIPAPLMTKEALYYLVDEYVKWNNIIDIRFIENLFHHKFFDEAIQNKILQHSLQCIARSSSVFFSIVKSVKIPQNFKNDVLDNIKIGNFFFTPVATKDLYAKVSPIKQAVPAKLAADLLVSCYNNVQFNKLALPKITQKLKQYINLQKVERLPLDTSSDNIFTNAQITGGRTVQVEISQEKAIFYKFRKPKEALTDFLKEGYFFEFLNYDADGKKLKEKLKSSVPELQKIVRMATAQLPKLVFSCEDGIAKFIDSNGVTCVDVLVFTAPANYLKYAHELDKNNRENPYAKAEIGMLTAIHDIGLFTSLGIYHTSTLPAYHFAVEERKWGALHMLLRKLTDGGCRGELDYPIGSDINMVGKLENWDTVATARPDYGYTGLRDFGDCEFFGEISSILQNKDSDGVKNFPAVIQNILAANTICECILACVLLYARLHKSSADYHYKNSKCKKNTADFIEKIFANFLLGRFQLNDINLIKFMDLADADYQKWLDRAVTEILYWTAAKQDLTGNNSIANFNFNDHVSLHIANRKLPENLYEHCDILDDNKFKIEYKNNNLGLDNSTFPLIALMNFIFLFNTRLNEYLYT